MFPQIHKIGAIHYTAQLLPIYNGIKYLDFGWSNTDTQQGKSICTQKNVEYMVRKSYPKEWSKCN